MCIRDSIEGAVGTLMTNMALEVAFKEMGVGFARANVGDRYVLEVLRERGWQVGGEGSGHMLCLDKHTTGDGIVSALQILSALKRSGLSLAQLTQDIERHIRHQGTDCPFDRTHTHAVLDHDV